MTYTPEELRRLADLDESDGTTEVGSAALPTDGAQKAKGALPSLAAILGGQLTFTDPLVSSDGVEVVGVVGHSGLILVDSEGAIEPLDHATARADGTVVLDARADRALARVLTADGEYLVDAGDGRVRLQRVSGEAAAPSVEEVPDGLKASELLVRYAPAPWLAERVSALDGSGWALDRVAAAGTLARLWRPATHAARLDALRTGQLGPVLDVRAWARARTPGEVAYLERLARVDLDALSDQLDTLAPSGADADPGVARWLAERRDALEGALTVLLAASPRTPLLFGLRAFDRDAETRAVEIAPAGALADVQWLAEVASAEPDAWWGQWGRR